MEADGLKHKGENTSRQGFFISVIMSAIIMAETMLLVMPHFANPVATYQFGFMAENLPMKGMPSKVMQSWADQ